MISREGKKNVERKWGRDKNLWVQGSEVKEGEGGGEVRQEVTEEAK